MHPGYGFLSESAAFAQAVMDAGLAWIGPSPRAIARLGDKVEARKIALKVGAPLVAGTPEPVKDAAEVLAFAGQHGLPIIIKAAFGGGGRGMKIAWRMDEVAELYASAVREATAAFGRGECFVEQFPGQAAPHRGPGHGRPAWPGGGAGHARLLAAAGATRSSSRRRPAPFLTDVQRQRIHQAAHDICAEVGYEGAGTVEFLLSGSGAISFLEVNTRLQVEHPVTEQTHGPGPRGRAAARGRRPAAVHSRNARAAGPRHRVPHQRRGRGPGLSAHARAGGALRPARGPGRARGQRRARRDRSCPAPSIR
ncbi:acetyl/propionyl-CoA carboxylase, alpha subunit [Alicycliphilus sp. B1]|nr:acetyl/propionyl-CoA carboxylase, alpha subunit [Alicycliphilus sp. B1]